MVATLTNRASFSGMLPILSINNSDALDVCRVYRKSYYDQGESVDEVALGTFVRANDAMSHKKPVTAKIRCLCCVCRGKWWSNSRIACWWHDVWHSRYREKSRRIDLLARIMFPFFFVIFNIIVNLVIKITVTIICIFLVLDAIFEALSCRQIRNGR